MSKIKALLFIAFFSGSISQLWAYEEGELIKVGVPPKEIELPFRDPQNYLSMADSMHGRAASGQAMLLRCIPASAAPL